MRGMLALLAAGALSMAGMEDRRPRAQHTKSGKKKRKTHVVRGKVYERRERKSR